MLCCRSAPSNMPVCVVCQNETFNVVDALYFCEMCGTQSQDIRDEEGDQFGGLNERLRVRKKGRSARKRKKYGDKGKPWVMCEALQFVIKAQVEALIKLGVNPKLKDVVGQIWFRYLQCTGVAFQHAPEGSSISVNSPNYRRDASIYGTPWKKNCQRKAVQKDVDDDELELCSQLSKEEFYDDDNPYIEKKDKEDEEWTDVKPPSDSDSDSDSDWDSEVIGSVQGAWGKRRRLGLKMGAVLAFPYLGLLWLKEPIFLSDLLRWTREGHLPLYNVTEVLPAYMKFKDKDSVLLYLARQMKRDNLRFIAGHIAQTVKLPELPGPDLRIYTSRFIADLHLPAVLHGCVNQLLQIFTARSGIDTRGKTRMTTVPPYEENAMAYIMIAMKLCYGLNDDDEKKQACMAEPRQELPTETLRVFEDWLGGFKRCFAERSKNGVPWSVEELNLLRDPSNYGMFCKTDLFGKWTEPDVVATDAPNMWIHYAAPVGRALSVENREKRSELFRSSASDISQSTERTPSRPSNFSTTCRHVARGEADGEGEARSGNLSQNCYKVSNARGIPFQKIRGEAGAQGRSKYFSYLKYEDALESVHSSYHAVLQILAARIECQPQVLHERVQNLESILFSIGCAQGNSGPRGNRRWSRLRKHRF